jgi:hypothetical protein
MKMPRLSVRSRLAAAAAVVTLAGGAAAVATATPAAAYGNTSVHQIELSANIPGTGGGGIWLWIGLDSDGTGDYHGADCGHGPRGGAASDGGTVTWTDTNGSLVITGIVLNGLPNPATGLPGFPATVTVPDTNGHYTGTIGSFITLPPFIPPGIGFSQLQVAP